MKLWSSLDPDACNQGAPSCKICSLRWCQVARVRLILALPVCQEDPQSRQLVCTHRALTYTHTHKPQEQHAGERIGKSLPTKLHNSYEQLAGALPHPPSSSGFTITLLQAVHDSRRGELFLIGGFAYCAQQLMTGLSHTIIGNDSNQATASQAPEHTAHCRLSSSTTGVASG